MKNLRRGEATTIVLIGSLIILGISAIASNLLLQKKQVIKSKASEQSCTNGWFCYDECASQEVVNLFTGAYGNEGKLRWMQEKANNLGSNGWYCLGECASPEVIDIFGGDRERWMSEKAENEFNQTGVRQQCADTPVNYSYQPPSQFESPPSNPELEQENIEFTGRVSGRKFACAYSEEINNDTVCFGGKPENPNLQSGLNQNCVWDNGASEEVCCPGVTNCGMYPTPTIRVLPTSTPVQKITPTLKVPSPTAKSVAQPTSIPTPTQIVKAGTNNLGGADSFTGCMYGEGQYQTGYKFCLNNILYECLGNYDWSTEDCSNNNQVCNSGVDSCTVRTIPTPTQTPIPTSTPVPTRTPTPTQIPTSTPLPSPTPQPQQPAVSGSVILDPGHGSPDLDPKEGKTPEGTLNLKIARKVKELLARKGISALLTHEKNTGILIGNTPTQKHYDEFQKRARRINELARQTGAKLFVSIHFDSSPYGSRGPAAYYNAERSFSNNNYTIAKTITSTISLRTFDPFFKRGSFDQYGVGLDKYAGGCCGPLYLLGPKGQRTIAEIPESEIIEPTEIPGILVEYFSNSIPYDSIMNNNELSDAISKGYCDGIASYLINQTCD